ncbi:MAG: hypothetical protein R3258_08265 [Acidimicrobiia bacterium]|nr:hypothetical protein [Acidimicrobiia bacterium]
MQEFLDRLKENPALAGGLLGGAVLLAVIIAVNLGGEPETPIAAPTTTRAPLDLFGRGDDEGLAGVPALDCSDYLELDEIAEALASSQSDGRDVDLRKEDEICDYVLSGDDRYFVRLEPGQIGDVEPGGRLLGVIGEPVPDIGDEALWFGGPDATGGGASGALSVIQSTPLGVLHFRIVLGRPDLGSPDQLAIAQSLASKALPRFPGMPLLPSTEVNLCELVSDAEAEEVLADYRDTHPATREEVFVTSLRADGVDLTEEGDSHCTKLILAEIYIRVQQGSLADFEPDAEYEGVVGEEITGVGDGATWFADVPYQDPFTAAHNQGVLAVRLGESAFRVVLAVPDTPAADQLETVTGLARGAIIRITGEEPVAEAVISEPDVVEPELGLAENLLALEQAGEWTLGEGLVATLGWFAGEAETSNVIASEPSLFELGDDVFDLAFDYLSNNQDDPSRAAVEELLRRLITTPGRLTATSAFEGQPPETAFRLIRVTSHDQGYKNTLDSSDYCWDVYGVEGGGCLKEVEIPDLDPEYADDYKLGRPQSDFAGAWGESHYSAAAEAVAKSAEVLEPRGDMPAVVVLFTQQAMSTRHFDIGGEQFCEFHIGVNLQGDTKDLQQTLAYALALCLFHDEQDAWWHDSMAIYLSGVIFPEHNFEHSLSSIAAGLELSTAVGDRAKWDWLFWEFLHPSNGGEGGNIRLARSAAAPGDMAGYPGMDISLRDFYRALTDANVPDLGFGLVPYEPKASALQISGKRSPVTLKPASFGVKRLRVEVVGHDYACISLTPQGDAQVLWREGREGESGTWTNEPPSAISGESIVVVTSTSGSGFASFEVKDVGDNDECKKDPEEPEPEDYNPPPRACGFCPFSKFFKDSTTYYLGDQ